jgi:hypothetical protein
MFFIVYSTNLFGPPNRVLSMPTDDLGHPNRVLDMTVKLLGHPVRVLDVPLVSVLLEVWNVPWKSLYMEDVRALHVSVISHHTQVVHTSPALRRTVQTH